MKMSFLFSFAVVADSHIRPDQADRQLTYPSDQVANARNRYAVEQINRFAPDLVVHLGDIVHPIPALPEHEATVQVARELYQGVEARLYVLPGNHDVGDKPNTWVPAPAVDERSHEVYEKYWGRSYLSFDHKNCHFVLINSPVLNSGLELEQRQREWLEQDLAVNQAAGRRVFLFTHYPLYLTCVDEQEHYDNIGEPARSWLLSLVEKYAVEAVFAGHVHNFFYNRHHNTDLYVLPSITFVRPEFSGLFYLEPASEYGRNDVEKLGFFLVRVHPAGHSIEWIRTRGRSQEQSGAVATLPFSLSGSESDSRVAPVGVSLRHAWADPVPLPSGSLDEFRRKLVRNDYLLAALWDLGIQRLRLPIADLLNPDTRHRMAGLRAKGHTFTVFSAGLPTRHLRDTVVRYQDLIDAWEVVVPWTQMEDAVDGMRDVKRRAAVRTILSKIETMADQLHRPESRFSHFPSHGFLPEDCDLLSACFAEWEGAEAADGLVFRVTADAPPWDGLQSAMRAAVRLSRAAIVQVQLQRGDEGVAYENDRLIAYRVTETLAAAWATGIEVFLDTFMDQDRGYYPRHGLIDRRCNPRPGYHAMRHLQSALGWCHCRIAVSQLEVAHGMRAFALEAASSRSVLLLPGEGRGQVELGFSPLAGAGCREGVGQWIDLMTGKAESFHWRRPLWRDERIDIDVPSKHAGPALLVFQSQER